MLQKPVGMAFLIQTFGIANHTGQQPHGGIQHRLRGDLAPGQNKVAKADLLDRIGIQQALVHTFKPTAEQGDAVGRRPVPRLGLGEGLAAGRQIHDWPARAVCRRASGRLIQRPGHHVGAQHHAGAAPCGRVIDIAMPPLAKRAQVDGFQLPPPLLQRLAGQGQAQRAGKSLGEQRDDAGAPRALQHLRRHQVTRGQAGAG